MEVYQAVDICFLYCFIGFEFNWSDQTECPPGQPVNMAPNKRSQLKEFNHSFKITLVSSENISRGFKEFARITWKHILIKADETDGQSLFLNHHTLRMKHRKISKKANQPFYLEMIVILCHLQCWHDTAMHPMVRPCYLPRATHQRKIWIPIWFITLHLATAAAGPTHNS